MRERLANPTLKDSITQGIIDLVLNDRGGGDLRRVQFAIVTWDRSLQSKTLHDWAVRRGMPSTPESAGEPVIANGSLTSARPGRVLRHEST